MAGICLGIKGKIFFSILKISMELYWTVRETSMLNPIHVLFCTEFLKGGEKQPFLCEPHIIFFFLLSPQRISRAIMIGLTSAFLSGAGEVIDQGVISSEEMCWS